MFIASCSFGKDSIATIILAHLNNEPLDLIVYSEVMFDDNTSGENPLHRDFIYNKAIPTFCEWGYQVKVVTNKSMNYIKSFYTEVKRAKKHPERNGKIRGFLVPFGCAMNSNCKVQPIREFYKSIKEPVTQYIGIAVDEPERLKRLVGTNKMSLLAKYGYTEKMAYKLCEQYDLLSPIYQHFSRGGAGSALTQEIKN